MTREELEKKFGTTYSTAELTKNFQVESFLAPLVIVNRKSDGARGTLDFQHMPRFYFNFRSHSHLGDPV
jgi:hypothetical protein